MTTLHPRGRVPLIALLAAVALGVLSPVAAAESGARQRRSDIAIRSDEQFDTAHGVRAGSGTADDPYVISGWDIYSLYIKDTSKHVTITDNTIRGTLTLDWIGDGVVVTNNDVGDLRVNQNVRRSGAATSGSIAHNTFSSVGQLRHWDGVFENNDVGLPSGTVVVGGEIFPLRAVNFDGFNGAIFRNNTIRGYVDARLHGHHHSSGFGDDSHHHSTPDGVDHARRFHEVWITGNTISAPYSRYALAYLDTSHAANDRTAASEQNPALNNPHVHFTRVHLTDNTLIGSGLAVDVFNSLDDRHTGTAQGLVEIDGNTISVVDDQTLWPWSQKHGIAVRNARDLKLYIRGNTITGVSRAVELPLLARMSAGIELYGVDLAAVRLYDNSVDGRHYGIAAYRMPATVEWFVDGLTTRGVDHAVHYDSTVKTHPKDRSVDPEDDDEDDEGGGGHHEHP